MDTDSVPSRKRALTEAHIAPLMKVVGTAVREHVSAAFGVLKEQIQKDEKRINAQQLQMDSLERRASRHAQHLNSLESRMKALERSNANKG